MKIVDGSDGLMTTERLFDYEKMLDHSWSYLISGRVQGGFSSTALVGSADRLGPADQKVFHLDQTNISFRTGHRLVMKCN